VTIVERPDALIVSSAFLSRRRAVALAVLAPVALGSLGVIMFGRPGTAWEAVAMVVVFGICGYYALILALDRSIATVRRDRIVVRHGPIPIWPAITIDTARIESVYATVAAGITGRGGRMVLDSVTASVTDGRSITLIDDSGNAADAERVAMAIEAWLGSHT